MAGGPAFPDRRPHDASRDHQPRTRPLHRAKARPDPAKACAQAT